MSKKMECQSLQMQKKAALVSIHPRQIRNPIVKGRDGFVVKKGLSRYFRDS